MKNLKKVLQEKKITPYRIQKDLGINEATIRGWMQGKIPQADLLFKVSDYLCVDPRYLFGLSDDSAELQVLTKRIALKLAKYEEKKPGSLIKFEQIIGMMTDGRNIDSMQHPKAIQHYERKKTG